MSGSRSACSTASRCWLLRRINTTAAARLDAIGPWQKNQLQAHRIQAPGVAASCTLVGAREWPDCGRPVASHTLVGNDTANPRARRGEAYTLVGERRPAATGRCPSSDESCTEDGALR